MRIDLIVGARPNLMKAAPLYHALKAAAGSFAVRLIHTGQHYDHNLSQAFFDDLGLPAPDVFLDVGSASHAVQTARIMERYEPLCLGEGRPDLVIVVGDVNSTVACAITAKKCDIRLAHLEAGLRSGDRTMPEEINRLVVDAIADVLWTPSPDADEHLRREGHSAESIQRVGNIMIDAYELVAPQIAAARKWETLDLQEKNYLVATFHRPANVDSAAVLTALADQLKRCTTELPVVFVVHPRTLARLKSASLTAPLEAAGVRLIEPLGYIEFMSLVSSCRLAVTDSGGIQEETTYLGIPCLTVRATTERPITVSQGTNRLVERDDLAAAVQRCLREPWPTRSAIPLWDGKTALRIIECLRTSMMPRPA